MSKKQLKLDLFKGKRGGRRPNSGRKRILPRCGPQSTGKSHKKDPATYQFQVQDLHPKQGLSSSFEKARSYGLRIIHFSMQTNHIHLIVEAESNDILTTGMRSLTITFAKGLKQGKVQLERYHLHVLR